MTTQLSEQGYPSSGSDSPIDFPAILEFLRAQLQERLPDEFAAGVEDRRAQIQSVEELGFFDGFECLAHALLRAHVGQNTDGIPPCGLDRFNHWV